ncbi:hypothetical protein FACS1894211_02020 [Clostridia bacterium]|nr:hypothetical protein FACS1894211_02020 [Clostridia bacterium]
MKNSPKTFDFFIVLAHTFSLRTENREQRTENRELASSIFAYFLTEFFCAKIRNKKEK